ncbi:MAG: hypothetical protein PHE73_01865 [Sulfurovaceae bacterium]|nr:hypothetical protein [Sulfurovaceae bacterium]
MENKKSQHSEPYRIYKAGDWELYVFFTNKGTKSEGQFGVLLENGSVYPTNINEEIETELGKMKYYGLNAQVPWGPTGWLFADKSKIPNSWT